MSTNCLSEEQLFTYLKSPYDCNENQLIEEHLMFCNKCRDELNILDTLMTGLRIYGKHATQLVKEGKSLHIKNEVMQRYINETCDEDENKEIVTHIAGCSNCLNDIFAIKKLLYQIRNEPAITKKSFLIAQFALHYPKRIPVVEQEAKDLFKNAAWKEIALFEIVKPFSFAFTGDSDESARHNEDYRKLETDKFIIEMIQPLAKEPTTTIGIVAKEKLEQAKVTICTEKEISQTVTFDNNRTIINKEGMQIETIRYIKVEKI
ncbi:MAG: hypothetical protein E3K37_03675 [Candidatus Kuenenia sp.]|nr:hypothetical protein [Candidatus Kuenenia hertensis]